MKRSAETMRRLSDVAHSAARSNVSVSDADPRFHRMMYHAVSSILDSMQTERELSDFPELGGKPLSSAQRTWILRSLGHK